MLTRISLLLGAILILLFAALPDSSLAVDKWRKMQKSKKGKTSRVLIGFKFGSYGSGTLKVDDREYETESGLGAGIFFDYPLKSKFYPGFAFDIYRIKVPIFGIRVEKEYLYNFSLTIKREYHIAKKKFYAKPGAGLGFALLKELGVIGNSTHLTAQILSEFYYRLNSDINFLGEAGLFWGLAGSDGDNDISGGPFLFIRAGLAFWN